MVERSEDGKTQGWWITPLILVAAGMLCTWIGWLSLLISHLSSMQTLAGLTLAGVMGYAAFKGVKWLSRWSRPAAVVVILYIIGVVVFLWPVACVSQSGRLGLAVTQHYCRCNGPTVKGGWRVGPHVPVITYCIGLETEDMWEKRLVFDINDINRKWPPGVVNDDRRPSFYS